MWFDTKKEIAIYKLLQTCVLIFPTVYVKDVERLFEANDGGSLFLLVPVRLGGECLNPIYIPCVQVMSLSPNELVDLE